MENELTFKFNETLFNSMNLTDIEQLNEIDFYKNFCYSIDSLFLSICIKILIMVFLFLIVSRLPYFNKNYFFQNYTNIILLISALIPSFYYVYYHFNDFNLFNNILSPIFLLIVISLTSILQQKLKEKEKEKNE